MRTAAVLPVKRFDAAKQRLERADRAALMRDMAAGVLAALREAARLERVLVVTADAEAAALATRYGCAVVDEGPQLRGHSEAAALGVARAAALGAERVLLVAGDCPLLRAEDVDALLGRHAGPGVVVLADRHGTGTNALLIAPPHGIDPAFGPGSRARHEALAAAAGLPCTVEAPPAFAYDVDTLDDLAAVELATR